MAPITLSARVANNATAPTRSQVLGPGIRPRASITKAISSPPTRLAAVPSRLTAPSVPAGTGRRLVISRVWRPQRLPISLPQVSASLALKLAAKATSSGPIQLRGARAASIASRAPTRADPQTFSGPRRPPRASARPRCCFSRSPSRVTREPRARYSTTASQPRQPRVPHRIVPRMPACTQPDRVSTGARWARAISPALRARASSQWAGSWGGRESIGRGQWADHQLLPEPAPAAAGTGRRERPCRGAGLLHWSKRRGLTRRRRRIIAPSRLPP